MKIKERYEKVIRYFQENHTAAETELHYGNPFELLVAVILSAQFTDKRVNMVTPELFKNFGTPQKMARATFEELFPYIKSISYPNNKTKHLIGMANMLLKEYGGKVPQTVEELVKLPGVGRKTANVIASVIYQQPTMAVDTHVFRVSKRIGLATKANTPLAVEKQLVKYIPDDIIPLAHHWLILHGRYVCSARNPKCDQCGLQDACKFFSAKQKLNKTP